MLVALDALDDGATVWLGACVVAGGCVCDDECGFVCVVAGCVVGVGFWVDPGFGELAPFWIAFLTVTWYRPLAKHGLVRYALVDFFFCCDHLLCAESASHNMTPPKEEYFC